MRYLLMHYGTYHNQKKAESHMTISWICKARDLLSWLKAMLMHRRISSPQEMHTRFQAAVLREICLRPA